jgi:hypothetical protein
MLTIQKCTHNLSRPLVMHRVYDIPQSNYTIYPAMHAYMRAYKSYMYNGHITQVKNKNGLPFSCSNHFASHSFGFICI